MMRISFMNSAAAPSASFVHFAGARATAFSLGLGAVLLSFSSQASVQIDTKPLTVTNAVPGNVVLVPSFEWPTAVTHAHNPGDTESNAKYSSGTEYIGYFNPNVCYDYVYSTVEADRYFKPAAAAVNRTCSGQWSGNFLNWAGMQAVDTFRLALTGGYRVKDDAQGNTWLEKGESDRFSNTSGNMYNDLRRLSSGAASAMPTGTSSVRTRIGGLHNQMWFVGDTDTGLGGNTRLEFVDGFQSVTGLTKVVPFGYGGTNNAVTTQTVNSTNSSTCPDSYTFNDSKKLCEKGTATAAPLKWASKQVLAVSMRVQVCDDGGIDNRAFCRLYGAHKKPEGLIQDNARRLRYSVFGYQTSSQNNEGALLRARQKFVGPIVSGEKLYPDLPANRRRPMDTPEWDPVTGVFLVNPDAADAAATAVETDGVAYSGVINYINRAGQVKTGNAHTRLKGGYNATENSTNSGADNVSDLYYAALRYLRGLGGEKNGALSNYLRAADYSGRSDTSKAAKFDRADGMVAVRDWYGTGNESSVTPWGADQGVGSDYDPMLYRCQTTVLLGIGDTNTSENRRASDTGSPGLTPGTDTTTYAGKIRDDGNFSGSTNLDTIAALAHWAHVNDIRSDIPNMRLGNGRMKGQNVSTYWVDVVEKKDYKSKTSNQYYLAAKYGGYVINDDDWNETGTIATKPDLAETTAGTRARWTSRASADSSKGNFYQPNNLFFANNGQAMVESLTLAFSNILDDISGSGGSFSSNTTRLETGAFTFQAKYSSNGWGGELVASSVNTSTGALTQVWDAKDWLAGHQNSANADSYRKRRIYYGLAAPEAGTGSSMAPAFTPGDSGPNIHSGLETLFYANESLNGLTTAEKAARLKYILGERANERQFNGTLRNRRGMLGDIVNSQPVFMGQPNALLYPGNEGYAAFVAGRAGRTPVLFVGANDGMLHAFDAGNGETKGREIFAYMPREAVGVLAEQNTANGVFPYWHPEYEHRYSVDGDITVADVYDGTKWISLLVGTMGRGGRTIYGMDVTDPANPKLLWEKTSDSINSLGNVLGKPIIARTANNQWRIFVGNGPNSSAGDSRLLVLDVASGNVAMDILAGSAGNERDNGLGPVNVWDSNRDGIFDTVYAGDMHGKMYRFSLSGSGSVAVLYDAGITRPITAAPLVARNPYSLNDTWVYFGTGRYLGLTDTSAAANANVQAWYGMMDKGTQQTEANLQEIDILHEDSKGRVIEAKSGLGGHEGWFMQLALDPSKPRGERMVVSPFFQGLTLIGTTRFPDGSDVCAPSGFGYTMAIDPFTGGRLSSVFFDADNNGTVGNDGDYHQGVPYSGLLYNSGPNNPIFIGDLMYTSMDDGSHRIVRTAATMGTVKRVSWREVLSAN